MSLSRCVSQNRCLSRNRCVRNRDDRGAVAVLVCVLVVALVGVAALVVDAGLARARTDQAQAAVDSAAVAAAAVMYRNGGTASARAAATDYLMANYTPPPERRAQFGADWKACTDCVVFTDATVTVSLEPLPAVDTRSPAILGSVYGASGYAAAARATATWSAPLPGDCLLCVAGDARFEGSSHGVGVVDGGNVKIGGGLDIDAPGALTVRSAEVLRGRRVRGDPAVDTGHRVLPLTAFTDPYRDSPPADPWSVLGPASAIPAARYDSAADRCAPPAGATVASLTAADASTCPGFDPGMYVIYPGPHLVARDGTGSSSAVTPRGGGTGVLFFLTCRSGSAPAPCSETSTRGAYLRRIGASRVALTGLTATDGELAAFRGFAVIADRFGTANTHILGSTQAGDLSIRGNVYLPGQSLIANDRTTVDGQVIVGRQLQVGYGGACRNTCLAVNEPTAVHPPSSPAKVRLMASP